MTAFCRCQGAPPTRWVKEPGGVRFVCAGCGMRARKNYTDEGQEMAEIDPTEHNHFFEPVEGGHRCACGQMIDRTQIPPVLVETEPGPNAPAVTEKPGPHAFVKSAEGSGKVCMADGCGAGPRAKTHKAEPVPEPAPPEPVHPDETAAEAVQFAHERQEPTYEDYEADLRAQVEANRCGVCGKEDDHWEDVGSGMLEPRPCPTGLTRAEAAAQREAASAAAYGAEQNPAPPPADEETPAWQEIPAPVVVSISGHTEETSAEGIHYCRECSRHVHDWVTWPCSGEFPERCEKHQMRVEYCAECRGTKVPEVMAVMLGTELPPEPIPMTWTGGCSCDLETLELMGCVCGGAGNETSAAPPPLAVAPPIPVTEAAPSGNVVPPVLEATPAPAEQGSPMVTHESTADVAVHGPRRAFSNSELRAFKRCRRKWWLTYYRKLSLRREGVGPLSIGNMIHWPLECYYGTPNRDPETFDWETPLAAHVEERLADPDLPDHLHPKMLEDYKLVKLMLRGYFEWLGEEGADSELRILAPEREIEAFIDHIDGSEVWLIGKLDVEAELRSDGRRVFVDHKSVANLADLPKTGQIDEQIPTYGLLQRLEAAALAAAGLPHAESFARGGVWNMLRKVKRSGTAKPPFYGRAGVDHNDEVYRNFYKRVWGEARDILTTTRNLDAGGDPLVEVYPMPTRDCAWDCPFFTICPMFDDGSDVEAVISMEYETHDPYARYTELEKG